MNDETGLCILIVEDEPIVAMLLEDYLIELGHDVLGPVATVAAALALCETGQFDLAILDVNINGDRSDVVAQALDRLGRGYMFATGYGLPGVDDAERQIVLQKPYRIDQLREALALLRARTGR